MTNYALGARGIDGISVTQNGTTSVGYPIYDAHGNRVASMTKHYSGQNVTGWDLLDVRTYDAWGNITNTNNSGRPRARYCANLGHVQDDESGLVYMRARYYEPTSGRFVSEDPSHHGANWFEYCHNDPLNVIDTDGRAGYDLSKWYGFLGIGFYAFSFLMAFTAGVCAAAGERALAVSCITVASAAAAVALLGADVSLDLKAAGTILKFMLTDAVIKGIIGTIASGLEAQKRQDMITNLVVAGYTAHTMAILGALTCTMIDE